MIEAAAHRSGQVPSMLMHWATPTAVGLSLASAAAFVAANNPHAQQLVPPCLLHSTTGIYCPGCGGTRAVYDVMQGDIAGALQMNAFAILFIIPPVLVGLLWWFAATMGMRTPRLRLPNWVMWTYLGLFGAFWVLRNVPAFAPYLAP